MRDAAMRLWRWYNTPQGKRLFRYSMVSVISTGVAQFTLFIVYGVLRLWSAVPCNIFANVVATVPSYYLNRSWAWGKTGKSHLMREVVPFWTMSLAGMTLSIITVGAAEHWGQAHGLHHLGLTILVQTANLTAFAILWVVKFLIFNRLFQTADPAADQAETVEIEGVGESEGAGFPAVGEADASSTGPSLTFEVSP